MVTKRIFHIAQFKTAARHWVPIQSNVSKTMINKAYFSSKQRCVNFNNISDASLVANDDVLSSTSSISGSKVNDDLDASFEPTINSSEEILTAGPVNRA